MGGPSTLSKKKKVKKIKKKKGIIEPINENQNEYQDLPAIKTVP
jgi:hypothetical protein